MVVWLEVPVFDRLVVAVDDWVDVPVVVNVDLVQPSNIPASKSYNAWFKSLADCVQSANLSARK